MNQGDHLILQGDVGVLTTGDKLALVAPVPLEIVRWGFSIAGTNLDATPNALIAKLDQSTHIADGSVTRSDGSGGTNLNAAVDRPSGTVVYAKPDEPFYLDQGDFVTLQITQAPTGGLGFPFIEYRPRAFDPSAVYADDNTVATSEDASTAI